MLVDDQSDVIAFLSRSEAFGPGAGDVERIETHASVVFLVGDRAYKLKRSVKYPYLDFSTLERRRVCCEAEVRINRRTAPDIYRGVVAVTRVSNGGLRLGGDGEPVEWLVEMARFDQDTLFDRLAQRRALDRFAMEDLADTIARFHNNAERRTDCGGRSAVAATIANNDASFGEAAPGILDPEAIDRLDVASRRVLAGQAALLDARRDAGFVRHCHGDLHLRNIFLDAGRTRLFDAIEFNQSLANIDVLYDLAFLIMDLDFRDLRYCASVLFNRYLDNTGDTGGLGALPLFLSMRAAVRSHVAAAAAREHSDKHESERLGGEARRYLVMALDYLVPAAPRLIAIGGLSGSGKSRMARALAPQLGTAPGARVVRSDSTRKRLSGVSLGTRLGNQGYACDITDRTYRVIVEEARQALTAGHTVIADAVFAQPEERLAIAGVAEQCGVPFCGLWLETSPEVMQERVTRRRRNVSDATPWVVRLQLSYDLGAIDWHRLDSSGTREETLARALESIQAAGGGAEAQPTGGK